jgi:hypothetical protein
MNTDVTVNEIISKFRLCQDFEQLEHLADIMGDSGNDKVIKPLLERLFDDKVQEDADVEDAVCSALVKMGVMERLGNLNFKFLDKKDSPVDVANFYSHRNRAIPQKYLR